MRQIAGELRDLTDSRLSAIYLVSDGVLVPLTVCSGGEFLFGLGACTCRLGDSRRPRRPSSMPVCRSRCPTTGCRPTGAARPPPATTTAGTPRRLLLPLAARGEAIGLVELCDTAVRDYGSHRSIAERLAKVAAGAVLLIGERRRLEARERVADELIELGDAVARAGTLAELVRPIAALLLASVEAVDCEIWRLEGGRMTCLASVDDQRLERSDGGHELRGGRLPLVPDGVRGSGGEGLLARRWSCPGAVRQQGVTGPRLPQHALAAARGRRPLARLCRPPRSPRTRLRRDARVRARRQRAARRCVPQGGHRERSSSSARPICARCATSARRWSRRPRSRTR